MPEPGMFNTLVGSWPGSARPRLEYRRRAPTIARGNQRSRAGQLGAVARDRGLGRRAVGDRGAARGMELSGESPTTSRRGKNCSPTLKVYSIEPVWIGCLRRTWSNGSRKTTPAPGQRSKGQAYIRSQVGKNAQRVQHLLQYNSRWSVRQTQGLPSEPIARTRGHGMSTEAMPLPHPPTSPVTASPAYETGAPVVTEGVTGENSVGHLPERSPSDQVVTKLEVTKRPSTQSPLRSPENAIFSRVVTRYRRTLHRWARSIERTDMSAQATLTELRQRGVLIEVDGGDLEVEGGGPAGASRD